MSSERARIDTIRSQRIGILRSRYPSLPPSPRRPRPLSGTRGDREEILRNRAAEIPHHPDIEPACSRARGGRGGGGSAIYFILEIPARRDAADIDPSSPPPSGRPYSAPARPSATATATVRSAFRGVGAIKSAFAYPRFVIRPAGCRGWNRTARLRLVSHRS